MAKPQENPTWDEAKDDIFISLYPDETDEQRPFAKNITGYFTAFYFG
ncbi:MAG: hypothetical protein LBG19_08680 [Prevotellaceae bacterium]|jgi:hypothetical protein|nr:hypothetical protein [Prevotellaceae bacterium]